MKITSSQAQALIETFKNVKVGKSCVFPSPLPALSKTEAKAFLISCTPGKAWEFRLFWYGIEMGWVKAKVEGDELVLEVL